MKKIIYIDMDGVLAVYPHGSKNPNFFNFRPIKNALLSFRKLAKSDKYDVYILSTAPWSQPTAWTQKRLWVQLHLKEYGFKRLILAHDKSLLKGDIIIDDRTGNGVYKFEGEHIHFGTEKFPNWKAVIKYLEP